MSVSPGIRGVAPTALLLLLIACDPDGPAPLAAPDDGDAVSATASLSPLEALGREIFFDRSLSLRHNQACAACHAPAFGFTGPTAGINQRGAVYMGSVRYLSGNRKPPSAAYAAVSPPLYWDAGDEVWVGGNFWDGRATGHGLGNPAADQALGPFLNPVEQALPDAICVLYRISEGGYADLWEVVWGEDLGALDYPAGIESACRSTDAIAYGPALEAQVAASYGRVGLSIAAYEGSNEVSSFTSKFDAVVAGMAELTPEEAWGFDLFTGKGQCSACHPTDGTPAEPALLTDFTYDNLGTPANPLNPVYQTDPGFVDLGLGAFLETPAGQALIGGSGIDPADFYGAVKVPTLRNVARSPGGNPKAFGHNGVFKSLEQIIHFYNTRDVLPTCAPGEVAPTPAGLAMMGYEPECWLPPEVAANVNDEELGALGLTGEEERALVAFLETLSDGWTP